MKEEKLGALRKRMDTISEELVVLLNKRAKVAQQIGQVKGDGPMYIPARERVVLERVVAQNKGPLTNRELHAIFEEVVAACRNLEHRLRVTYLGPPGTYSEEAARRHLSNTSDFIPCDSLDATLAEAEKNERDVAVLPIENSTEGGVSRTLDLLLDTPLHIVGETTLAIHHQLLTKAADLADITEVSAHPQALAQCRRWLAAHLPQATQHAASSNAEAARLAADNPQLAAIASIRAAELYQLPILAQNIEDEAGNATRFVVLGHEPTHPTGSDKTSLVCSVSHTPGSLGKLITGIADAGVNMIKLESRPSRSGTWDYVFYIDLEGHAQDEQVAKAIATVRQRSLFVKLLGSYPKALA
jgi:chorismate mutase/prephenate dehydratase